ncbi:MAG: hypothetical protein ING75_03790 [Rhodocyclaceae bacterium]|nr:hypothetical protein [Rhodocyclaceae bacterium]
MNSPLFQISLYHHYFCDGVYASCPITPDDRTGSLLYRYRFLTRIQNGVLGCYSPSDVDSESTLEYMASKFDGEPLRFLMRCEPETFFAITDLPLNWVGQLIFDSRLTKSGELSDPNAMTLLPTFGPRTVEQPNTIAVITIHIDDLLGLKGNSINYRIDLPPRSMPWRYYIVNRSETKLHQPAVRDQSGDFLDGPNTVLLPGGVTGLCFSSGARHFPLKQVPTKKFDLIDRMPQAMERNGSTVERCVISGLPTPTGDQIQQEKDGKDVFGAMYVYL